MLQRRPKGGRKAWTGTSPHQVEADQRCHHRWVGLAPEGGGGPRPREQQVSTCSEGGASHSQGSRWVSGRGGGGGMPSIPTAIQREAKEGWQDLLLLQGGGRGTHSAIFPTLSAQVGNPGPGPPLPIPPHSPPATGSAFSDRALIGSISAPKPAVAPLGMTASARTTSVSREQLIFFFLTKGGL